MAAVMSCPAWRESGLQRQGGLTQDAETGTWQQALRISVGHIMGTGGRPIRGRGICGRPWSSSPAQCSAAALEGCAVSCRCGIIHSSSWISVCKGLEGLLARM